jgi:RimJ/RimL family protein N-acetyltransferase
LYNDVVVGVVGLYKHSALQYPDLGFALVSGFEKKGYIFEAANVLVQNIHKLGITQLSAITSTDNMASQNVLARLGFSKVGMVVINNDKTAVNVFLLNNQSSG